MHEPEDRLPVSILTGFLGSGKTTLLNKLLAHPEMGETAVIVNEFGEIGIDNALMVGASDQVLLLESGCLCCTMRGELIETLGELLSKRQQGLVPAFVRIVIETTGLADPAPILQALMTDLLLLNHFRMGTVATVVDAVHGVRTLDEHPEAVCQVALADCLLISKTDLNPAGLAELEARLQLLNPAAHRHAILFGEIDPHRLFGNLQFDPARKAADVDAWLKSYGQTAITNQADQAIESPPHHHRIRSYSIRSDVPLVWESVAEWLDDLALVHGDRLLRVKGLLHIVGQEEPVLIQGVRKLFHPPIALPDWPDDDHSSRLVFIVQGLDRDTLLAGAPFR